MAEPEILVFGGFRSHVLIPHDVCGSIIDNVPTWGGMTVDPAGIYWRNSKAILSVSRHEKDGATRVVVRAFDDVWLQEPGLVVKIAGEGVWRGYGPNGKWTSPIYKLRQKDAHRSTVHFSRVKTNPDYTVGVEYRVGGTRLRFHSDGGFTKLLDTPAGDVPWTHCQVFGEGYELDGVVSGPETLRRWELAGRAPDIGQCYFLGWTGGAACVVNKDGRDVGAPGDRFLWQPKSWRRLRRGESITQTLEMRRM